MNTDSHDRETILNARPSVYITQRKPTCGLLTIDTILNAYGKPREKEIRNYLDWRPANLPFALMRAVSPTNVQYALQERGLSAEARDIKHLSTEKRATLVLECLKEGKVVAKVISCPANDVPHDYTKTSRLIPHWVSVYGCLSRKNEPHTFLLYDSWKSNKNTLPIGNAHIPARKLFITRPIVFDNTIIIAGKK